MTFRQLQLVAPDFPDPPIIGTAIKGNTVADVYFSPPVSNGGADVTSYTATSSPGGFTNSGATSPRTVAGLSNGTAYTFTVKATNSFGQGPASSASNSVTPSVGATAPGAPTAVVGTLGNTQVSVAFTAPASDGGSAITSYTATSSPGSFTASGAASPLVVTGLTNGTAYTFTVTATNAIGTGPASTASASVTPATLPGAPTIGTATKGDTTASITFTAPSSDGGSAITSYTATSTPGSLTGSAASSPVTVSGLTNGTAYTFTITATNSVGTGSASAASNSVTPSTVPGAPTIGTATAGSGSATAAFTAPGSNGGSAITSYTATSNPGGVTGSGASSPVTVTGLTAGTSYTFTVTATNANGVGAASAASNAVVPTSLGATLDPATFTGNGDVSLPQDAFAKFRLNADGYAYKSITDGVGGTSTIQLFQWKTGTGTTSSYEAVVTTVSGTAGIGTLGTAQNLGTTRVWEIDRYVSSGVGTTTWVIGVTIQPSGGGTALAGPTSMTMKAKNV